MYKSSVAFAALMAFNASADGFGNETSDADVIKMSMHYINQFNGISSFLAVLAFFIGFVYVFKMLSKLPALADRNNQNVTGYGLFLYAVAGTVLMYIGASQLVVHEMMFGSFGGEFESPFNYSMQAGVDFSGTAEEANAMMLQQFFKMVGAMAFVYGASLIPALDRSHPNNKDVSMGKVLTFMISGVLSMTPGQTLEILIEFIPYLKVFTGN